jgi:hypothetical protein
MRYAGLVKRIETVLNDPDTTGTFHIVEGLPTGYEDECPPGVRRMYIDIDIDDATLSGDQQPTDQ